MKKEEKNKALEHVKKLCDFMLDETGTIEFEQTGEECIRMINCLVALKQTAELFLKQDFLLQRGDK